MGHEGVGRVGGASLEVRDMRDGKGASVRGLVVRVTDGKREELAYIDLDEMPALLKGIDALLNVTENPTPLMSFEVSYSTRGLLSVSVGNPNGPNGPIAYRVQAGRYPWTRVSTGLGGTGIRRLREFFEIGQQKLSALESAK